MELRRVLKGIRAVLEEHGCYPPTKANGNPACKAKCSRPKCLDSAQYPPPPGPPCCMARILQNHKDFREQQSIIAQLIEDRGHKCIFLPKFHCELNPIEMYWGYAKARFRQVVKKTTKDGKREVPLALDACTTDTYDAFVTAAFGSWMRTGRGLQLDKQLGASRNKRGTEPYQSKLWTAWMKICSYSFLNNLTSLAGLKRPRYNLRIKLIPKLSKMRH